MKKAKQTLKEMLVGLSAWLLLVLIILVIIATHKIAMVLGVLLGGGTAAGLLFHMYRHLDIALDMDVKHAQSHIQSAAMKRLFFMALVVALSMAGYRYAHPLGTIFGLFGTKVSAYLQPTVHRIMGHIQKR